MLRSLRQVAEDRARAAEQAISASCPGLTLTGGRLAPFWRAYARAGGCTEAAFFAPAQRYLTRLTVTRPVGFRRMHWGANLKNTLVVLMQARVWTTARHRRDPRWSVGLAVPAAVPPQRRWRAEVGNADRGGGIGG